MIMEMALCTMTIVAMNIQTKPEKRKKKANFFADVHSQLNVETFT